MQNTLWVGAVAYDPKVVPIWEGMQRYFREETDLPVEVVLFLSYEAQVTALLAGRIDIAWNTNLAYLQCEHRSKGQCAALGMRDTDLGWTTKIIAPKGGNVQCLQDLRGKRLAIGSRDSGHAAILPVYFLEQDNLVAGKDYELVRFNTDLGKHGDTGTSELDVLSAVLSGQADAGAVGSPFWAGVQEKGVVPAGALVEVWSSPAYSHCMFTARAGLDAGDGARFIQALEGMSYDNPAHRPVLEAEGLKRWLRAQTDGYASLRDAAERQGFFNP